MFRRRAGRAKPAAKGPAGKGADPAAPFTYIQTGTTIAGRLEARGRVRVHGLVRGDIDVDGVLEVAESGRVEGHSIKADEVKIIGSVVVERLVARGKVEIWSGGELVGDVTAASLDIEEGARFTGRSQMADAEALPAPERRPAADPEGALLDGLEAPAS